MKLHELIYISLATREMTRSDLAELLEQSRRNNARLNITGLLVYYNREFMQLLEGDKSAIFSLYETISKDNRHTRVNLMWDGPVQQRSFADWSMAFVNPGELSLQGNPAYSSFLKHGLDELALNTPRTMGKTFLLTLRDDFLRK